MSIVTQSPPTFTRVQSASLPTSTEFATGMGAGGYYASASGAFAAETHRTVRLVFRLDKLPTAAVHALAMFSGSGTGWSIWTNTTGDAVTTPSLLVFAGINGGIPLVGRKVFTAECVGATVRVYLRLSTSANAFVDGRKISVGTVSTSSPIGVTPCVYNPPSVGLGIGADASGGFPGEQSIIELAISSTALTDDQILADSRLPIGSAMLGEIHRYTFSGSVGATWTDAVGSAHLTRSGSPAVSRFRVVPNVVKRTIIMVGDSLTAGQLVSLNTGDGSRRAFLKELASRGVALASVGYNFPNASASPDYDIWHCGTGSESAAGRIATWTNDLANIATSDAALLFAYGTNDFLAYTPMQTSAQFFANAQSMMTSFRAVSPTGPIGFKCLPPCGSGVATAPRRAEVAAARAVFATQAPLIKAAVGGPFRYWDPGVLITNPDDPSQLYDQVHYSDAKYAEVGTYDAQQFIGAFLE